MRFILAPTSSYPSENVFHNVCFLPFRVYSTDNQLIIDTFADTKMSKNVQLYYQKVVNLPFFVTFPFFSFQKNDTNVLIISV